MMMLLYYLQLNVLLMTLMDNVFEQINLNHFAVVDNLLLYLLMLNLFDQQHMKNHHHHHHHHLMMLIEQHQQQVVIQLDMLENNQIHVHHLIYHYYLKNQFEMVLNNLMVDELEELIFFDNDLIVIVMN